MMYILINERTKNYFKKEMLNEVCIDVDNIEEARKFDTKQEAENKCKLLGGERDRYFVVEIN